MILDDKIDLFSYKKIIFVAFSKTLDIESEYCHFLLLKHFEIANNVREKKSIISHGESEAVPYRRKGEAADDKHSATHNRLILEIQHKNVEERSFSNFKRQRGTERN